MGTMKEIAEKAGVSVSTVSRVLSGSASVAPNKRQLVMEWVRKMDYKPNVSAQILMSKRSALIGIIVPDFLNLFFVEVLNQVEREATLHGYNIILCNSEGQTSREREHLASLKARQVDGILLAAVSPSSPILTTLKNGNIPAVTFTQELKDFDSVSISHYGGGSLVARHFVDIGHTRTAFIGPEADPKFQGFRDYLQRAGLEIRKDDIITLEDWKQNVTHEAYLRTEEWLKRMGGDLPTAIFAFNDMTAFGVLHACRSHELRIPQDIAVAGFDNIFISRESIPAITTIAQPNEEIGRLAINMLLNRITGKAPSKPERVELEPRLIPRESTVGVSVV